MSVFALEQIHIGTVCKHVFSVQCRLMFYIPFVNLSSSKKVVRQNRQKQLVEKFQQIFHNIILPEKEKFCLQFVHTY